MKDEIGRELEVKEEPLGVLEQTNPMVMVEGATAIAKVLSNIIEEQHLFVNIKGRKHVKVEGWTTLGAMVGVFPYVEYASRVVTADVLADDEIQYEARVTVKNREGDTIGSAEAICSSKERNWKNRDEYAIKSMAQTRAVSKALRLPLGWIMTLSGYDATPAEEMPRNGFKSNYETRSYKGKGYQTTAQTTSQGPAANKVKPNKNVRYVDTKGNPTNYKDRPAATAKETFGNPEYSKDEGFDDAPVETQKVSDETEDEARKRIDNITTALLGKGLEVNEDAILDRARELGYRYHDVQAMKELLERRG